MAAAAAAAINPTMAPTCAHELNLGKPAWLRRIFEVMRSPMMPPNATAKPARRSHLLPAAVQSVAWALGAGLASVITVPTANRNSPSVPCPSTPVASHRT